MSLLRCTRIDESLKIEWMNVPVFEVEVEPGGVDGTAHHGHIGERNVEEPPSIFKCENVIFEPNSRSPCHPLARAIGPQRTALARGFGVHDT
jgi:hypothetical protein